jgi:sugar O-acyltransferase (sialic acid O-acetyltransferase NeuD family)
MFATPLVIIGAGGFASEGAWAAEDINAAAVAQGHNPCWSIRGFAVFDPSRYPPSIYSYPVLGTISQAAAALENLDASFICMIGDNHLREENVLEAQLLGWNAISLVHPTVVRARETTIGPGSYIGAGSILSPFAQIGAHVVINHHVSVGHDSILHDFSQVCPGARISGKCVLGRASLVGSNATLLPGCRVGDGATVGAGSVALRSVAALSTVMGVPAGAIRTADLMDLAK